MKILTEMCFSRLRKREGHGHGVTLPKKQRRIDIRKFTFSQRTVNERNRLPDDDVCGSSVNILQIKLTYTTLR